MKRRARQEGSALLAIMLVATVAFAAVLLAAFDHGSLERAREERTQALLAQASEALLGFAATHGRLPRPAQEATPDDGRERAAPCASEADCTGLLPWRDLGLPAQDHWGHALRYSVTPGFTAAPLARTALVATKRLLSRDANGSLFFSAGQEGCSLAAQCAPAVILSRGASDIPDSQDEAGNRAAAVDFMYRPRSSAPEAPGGAFDDLLATVPLSILYQRMAAARTLP